MSTILSETEIHAVSGGLIGGGSFGPLLNSIGNVIGSVTQPPSSNAVYNTGNVMLQSGHALSGFYGNLAQVAPPPLQPAVPWAILAAGTGIGAVVGGIVGAVIGGAAAAPF